MQKQSEGGKVKVNRDVFGKQFYQIESSDESQVEEFKEHHTHSSAMGGDLTFLDQKKKPPPLLKRAKP